MQGSLLLVFVLAATVPPLVNSRACDSLEQVLGLWHPPPFAVVRKVESSGTDSTSCLNVARAENPSPCASLDYALHSTSDPESRLAQTNIIVYVGAGTYKTISESAVAVINSENVTIVGSGQGQTFFHCGGYEESDSPCSYMNFQIRNSTNVYVRGITFTRCGPITSAVYIASSQSVTFEDCEFRDNKSPPLLVYNTSPFVLNNTNFRNNHPRELNDSITTNICYFSGGVNVFFLDNRTSSGGLSHYSEGEPSQMLIVHCEFVNNTAKPDMAVSLPRKSEGYGHGGAANIRLSNSNNGSICVKDCLFEDNAAEAQAGAVALTLGGSTTKYTVELANSNFSNNSCTLERCTGGAVGIDFFSGTQFNEILIKGTDFIRNYATDGMGGAISLSTTVDVQTLPTGQSDMLLLENCLFQENEAFYDGTAVGVFSLTHTDQIGLPVNITDCHFQNNVATRGSADSTALTAYRALLRFNNKSSFVSNQGGGISLLGSRMDVLGEVRLDRNVAVFGAGIAMTARSLLLLYEGAILSFTNNLATDEGAGLYVEYTSSDFVLPVLNRGCFIQYFTRFIDLPPNEWNVTVEFVNNSAGIAGAAIYANDMSRCKWLGPMVVNETTEFIFNPPSNYRSPFVLKNNILHDDSNSNNDNFATDASKFSATIDYGASPVVGYGEKISFHLNSSDQLGNFRESVWSFNTESETQILGALSSNDSLFEYEVPSQEDLTQDKQKDDININAEFSLLGGQASVTSVVLQIRGCHPGYQFDEMSQTCVCDDSNNIVVQCDEDKRYFYARDGYWVGLSDDQSLISSTTVTGFLNCTRQGALPGCEIRYDSLEEQCAQGRQGILCGECKDKYGATFDLRFCTKECNAGGIILLVFICFLTVFVALFIVFFNFALPDEVKGFVFFAQVIGLIYRNAPYISLYRQFAFIFNLLGFSLPFQVCLAKRFPVIGIALLGFVPPLLATSVAISYVLFAKKLKHLSERATFNGFHFLFVFVYKYFLDTSFIFISCTLLGDSYVFIYQGTVQCFEYPFVILFSVGLVFIIGLGVVLPAFLLYLVYRPGKHVQAADALTCGLKRRRRYRWYGVWDVWRRILFVAANLFISVTTRDVVLLIHCLLIFICLIIACLVKPYKKAHNNILEVLVLLCLLGATLAILDDNDVNVGAVTSIVFAMLPFICVTIYIIYRLGNALGKYAWAKAKAKSTSTEGEVSKFGEWMEKLSTKYERFMASKPVTMMMSVAAMIDEQDTDEKEAHNPEKSSTSLPSSRSHNSSKDNSTGTESEVTVLDSSGSELPHRAWTMSSDLREPLLDEEHM